MGSCASVPGKNPDSSSSATVKYRVPFFRSSKTDKNLIPPTPVKEKLANVDVVSQPPMTNSVGYKSQVSPFNSVPSVSNNGSKDETFFDSQAWLDSDCESDFYSVNGDFTPSRGSTPVHGSGTPRVSRPWSQLNNTSPEGKLPFNSAFFEDRVPLKNETSRSRGSRPLDCSVSAAAPQSNGTPSGGYVSFGSSANSSPSGKRKRLSDLLKDTAREGDNRAAVNKNPEVTNPAAVDLPPKSANTTPYNSMSSVERTPCTAVNSEREKQPQCCLPRFVSSYSPYEKKSTTPPAINVDA